MEKRLNTKFDVYIKNFKDGIRDKMMSLSSFSPDQIAQLMEFVYEYNHITLNKDDFIKRKRVKNSIPENNRCIAKRATGEQCTRRRKAECDFCGTHSKGSPHGVMTTLVAEINQIQNVELFAQDIKGIVYYLDQHKNVYNTEDVMSSKENPQIIAKWEKQKDEYVIPSLGLI
jgi:hypothetical protein